MEKHVHGSGVRWRGYAVCVGGRVGGSAGGGSAEREASRPIRSEHQWFSRQLLGGTGTGPGARDFVCGGSGELSSRRVRCTAAEGASQCGGGPVAVCPGAGS